MFVSPTTSIVGDNPVTINCLNACAFQQSALTTVGQLQYVAFYSSTHPSSGVRHVTIARRNHQIKDAPWIPLTFTDYDQMTDDGHNTISIGVCLGDGTIHVAFDHHCSELKYRVSRPGLADNSTPSSWTLDAFGPIQSKLPTSAVKGNSALVDVTYPRFIRANSGLFFECRIGKYAIEPR
ncbi:dockerin type 1 [Penicillium lividum]|nr:dockerin type 1 [Penicillium lividum]